VVSIDHFRYELVTQLRTAWEQGAQKIVITSTDLSRSVRGGNNSMDACCQAMQDEFNHGDVILQAKNSGSGMIVRYQLPRENPSASPK
jgi:hypothetical protein